MLIWNGIVGGGMAAGADGDRQAAKEWLEGGAARRGCSARPTPSAVVTPLATALPRAGSRRPGSWLAPPSAVIRVHKAGSMRVQNELDGERSGGPCVGSARAVR